MRDAPTAIKNWLPTSNTCWRADLVTITLLSGTVYRWTTADCDLSSGGYTFSSGPIQSRTLRQGMLPEIDALDIELAGAHQIGGVLISLLASQGVFDDARIQADHVIGAYPGDFSMGVISSWFEGRVAGVEPQPTALKLSAAADTETLSFQMLPRFTFQASCGHVVYDANCGLWRAGLTNTTGVVSGTPTVTTFASAMSGAAGYYNGGVVTFTSGALNGVRRSVKSFSSGSFTLTLPLPSAPVAGVTFSAYPGCTRTVAACTAFGNNVAIRAFPHIPVSSAGTASGGSASSAPKSEQPPGAVSDSFTQTVETGSVVPIVYGTARLAGNVLEQMAALKLEYTGEGGGIVRWQPSTAYAVGDVRAKLGLGNALGGYATFYVCTTAGTSSSTGTIGPGTPGVTDAVGADVTDGTAHWTRIADGYHQGLTVGLCEGPIVGIGAAWRDKYLLRDYLQLAAKNVPAWTQSTTYQAGDVRAASGNIYACTVGGPSTIYNLPPKGDGTDIVDGSAHWANISNPAINISLLTGTQPQTRPLWATRAVGGYTDTYSNTALVFFDTSTGITNSLPNMAWEIQGVGIQSVDANPADIAIDLLTHARRGAGWSSSKINSTTTGTGSSSWRTYCTQSGLLLSWVIDAQRSALDLLGDLLKATSTDAVWSGGKIKFVPRCDQVVGTFTPSVTPLYDLNEDDWIEPLQISRVRPADCYNSTPVQYVRRADAGGALVYQTDVVDNPDLADIDLRGKVVKAPTVALPFVMSPEAATMVSRIYTQRSLGLRNTWTAKVPGWKYCLTEPTDIVTISDIMFDGTAYPRRSPVKINAWEETVSPDGLSSITLTCEDYPAAAHHAAQYTPQGGDGYKPNLTDPLNGIIIGAGQVAPVSIPVDNLTAGASDNLWANGNSEASPPPGADTTTPEWAWRVNSGGAYSGGWIRQNVNTSGAAQQLGVYVPCSPGDAFHIEAQCKTTGAYASVFMNFYDQGGTHLTTTIGGAFTTSSSTWTKVYATGTAPASAATVYLLIANDTGTTGSWDAIYARRMIDVALFPSLQTGSIYGFGGGGLVVEGLNGASGSIGTNTITLTLNPPPIPYGYTSRVARIQTTQYYALGSVQRALGSVVLLESDNTTDYATVDLTIIDTTTGAPISWGGYTPAWGFDVVINYAFV